MGHFTQTSRTRSAIEWGVKCAQRFRAPFNHPSGVAKDARSVPLQTHFAPHFTHPSRISEVCANHARSYNTSRILRSLIPCTAYATNSLLGQFHWFAGSFLIRYTFLICELFISGFNTTDQYYSISGNR